VRREQNINWAIHQLGALLYISYGEVAVGRGRLGRWDVCGPSIIILAAGGEMADLEAVNNRRVAECSKEAVKACSKSMVVISASWVTQFSLHTAGTQEVKLMAMLDAGLFLLFIAHWFTVFADCIL